MQLETERLILRSFREEDVDVMAQLFANPDFMRFSLGVFTERKQTVAFIEKVIGWDRAGIPSQFAVVPRGEEAVIGYCGFFHHAEVPGEIERGVPAGSRLLEPWPHHRSGARCSTRKSQRRAEHALFGRIRGGDLGLQTAPVHHQDAIARHVAWRRKMK